MLKVIYIKLNYGNERGKNEMSLGPGIKHQIWNFAPSVQICCLRIIFCYRHCQIDADSLRFYLITNVFILKRLFRLGPKKLSRGYRINWWHRLSPLSGIPKTMLTLTSRCWYNVVSVLIRWVLRQMVAKWKAKGEKPV